MKTLQVLLMALVLPFAANAASAEAAIRAALDAQVQAWNRGDIQTFVSTYAEDCTFVGKTVTQGREKVLARYKTSYGTREAMGQLTFDHLTVRSLDKEVAVVTGEFHLERSAAGGGPAHGIFSLVFELHKGQWMIALDHTS
jgi:uncharacterized protein (TIGR02246 family)